MTFVIRPYTPEDAPILNRTFRDVFKAYRTTEYWHAVYEQCPDGYLITLALTGDGAPAGCYGCTLHKAFDARSEREYRCGQVRDVFTVPGLRGRSLRRESLVVRLCDNLLDTLDATYPCDFLFGFPSKTHLRLGKLMMQYRELPQWRDYYCPVQNMTGYSNVVQVRRVSRFDEAFDRLCAERRTQNGIKVNRDSAYLNWRFRPGEGYEIRACMQYLSADLLGYVVLKPRDNEAALLLDFVWPVNTDIALAFWRHVCSDMQARGVKEIQLRCSQPGYSHGGFQRLGFGSRRLPQDNFPVFRCLGPRVGDKHLTEDFVFTLADTDLY